MMYIIRPSKKIEKESLHIAVILYRPGPRCVQACGIQLDDVFM